VWFVLSELAKKSEGSEITGEAVIVMRILLNLVFVKCYNSY